MFNKQLFKLSFLFLFYFGSFNPLFATDKLDSLLSRVEFVTENDLPDLYMNLFIESRNNFDSAMLFAERASYYSFKLGDSLNYTRAEYAKAFLFKGAGKFNEAIDHYKIALRSAKNNGFVDREKASLNGLALAYYNLSNFDQALRYHFESLALREKSGNPDEIAVAANNIGLVYFQLSNHKKAIVYFERALKVELDNNISGIEGTYVNLGLAYTSLNEYDEAFNNFDIAINKCHENCEVLTKLEAYLGAGSALIRLNSYNKAKNYIDQAFKIAINENLEHKLASIYFSQAKIEFQDGKFYEAIEKLDKSKLIAFKYGLREWVKNDYKLLALSYSKMNQYDKAYVNQVLYDSVSNEILNEAVAKNLLQIQVDFEERQNLEIIKLQNKELSIQSTLLILSIIISLLTVFIVLILYRNNKVRRRVNNKLFEANNTIESQNRKLTELNLELEERVKERTEELRNSNIALLQSNQDLDNFIYKTSHDIRGPLATLQGICNIALMDVKESIAVDYLQKLSKTAHKLNQILSKLLVINQINNSLPNHEEIKLYDLVNSIIETNKISYLGKDLEITFDLPKDMAVESDYELLTIILSNLINNAFKFHNKSEKVNSFIKVHSNINNGVFVFEIIDNGIGVDDGISDQIFDIFSKTSELHDAAGLGLYLVKLAVDKLSGKISVNTNHEGYTSFIVQIPIE